MTGGDLDEGKLGAYRANGGTGWDARPDEPVLYLGAAEGVTAQSIARLVPQAPVIAVEKSPVASLNLIETAQDVDNLVPYLADARRPGTYAPLVPSLGLIYQDVAQRDQVEIFLDNVRAFEPRRGLLAVKAPSIAVDRAPEDVFEEAAEQVGKVGEIVDVVDLEPYHRDHAMIVADFEGA